MNKDEIYEKYFMTITFNISIVQVAEAGVFTDHIFTEG